MEAAALKVIRDMALAADKGCQPATVFPTIALPGSYDIHDLEQWMPNRNQFRGKMKTVSIKDFCSYVNEQAAAAIFIDQECMAATAFFDLGDELSPGHAKHQAYIGLKQTAAHKELDRIDGQRLSQKEAAEFLEDWIDSLAAVQSGGEPLDMRKAITGVRSVKAIAKGESEHNTQQFAASRSAMESIDLDSDENKPLPSFLDFKITPWHGLGEYTYQLRVSVIFAEPEVGVRKQSGPGFIFRTIKREEIEEEASDEFAQLVADGISVDSAAIYKGAFNPNG